MDQQQFQRQMQAALDKCFGVMTDPDKLYIIMPNSIGDMVISGGLTYSVLPRFGKRSAAMILRDRLSGSGITFDCIDTFYYLTVTEMYYVNLFCHLTNRFVGPNFILGNPHPNNMPPVQGRLKTMVDDYRKDIFEVPYDTPLHAPIVKDVSEEDERRLRQQYIIDKERTVIIAPNANSIKPFAFNFWQKFIAAVSNRGGWFIQTSAGIFWDSSNRRCPALLRSTSASTRSSGSPTKSSASSVCEAACSICSRLQRAT
ncbi:MAG: hypothetical protein IJU71_06880 [Selenomonadaceae bacterium]|nr:hypothetical protein [Selenomonadaceae bacterium]